MPDRREASAVVGEETRRKAGQSGSMRASLLLLPVNRHEGTYCEQYPKYCKMDGAGARDQWVAPRCFGAALQRGAPCWQGLRKENECQPIANAWRKRECRPNRCGTSNVPAASLCASNSNSSPVEPQCATPATHKRNKKNHGCTICPLSSQGSRR